MKTRLLTFCGDWESDPQLYVVRDEDALKYRYRYLQLRDTSELRLDSLCSNDQDKTTTASGNAARRH